MEQNVEVILRVPLATNRHEDGLIRGEAIAWKVFFLLKVRIGWLRNNKD